MPHRVVHAGPVRLVVTEPEPVAFGHIVTDLAVSLHTARALRMPVLWIRPRRALNTAVLQLRSDDVATLRQLHPSASIGRTLWRVTAAAVCARMWLIATRRHVHARVAIALRIGDRSRAVQRDKEFSRALLNVRKERRRTHPGAMQIGIGFRESFARAPIRTYLPTELVARAAREAARLGIDSARPIVTLHARESGYKAVHGDAPTDTMRNARIETYLPAIDELVARGFTVVRIGDATMTSLQHPGAIDLATSPARTDVLELWCVLSSRFLIACDSGPSCLGVLTQVPCLSVNVTNPVAAYPLLEHDLYILKHVRHVPTGRILSLREQIRRDYLFQRKNLSVYEYLDNSPEDIRAAIVDMLDHVECRPEPTVAQRKYRAFVDAALDDPEVSRLITKGSSQEFFVGDGRIGATFAERYLDAAARPPSARTATEAAR